MPTLEFAASFGRLAANHLWQSTGFAAVAVLLALALRANHARARYWLWLAASVKFLVPFSVLAAIGSSLGRWFAPARPVARLPYGMEQIVQPFAPFQDAAVPGAASAPSTTGLLPALLLVLWFCGFVAVLLYGWVRWRRVAAAVRASTPLTEGRELEAWGRLAARQPARRSAARADWQSARSLASCLSEKGHAAVRLVSSTAKLEPGVFGIFRPVLWLPAGIGDRLEDAELEAILAHELCHVRRRDNLLATIHMAVEAIFWFHPLVWWLGARLEEERERACDEEVVRMGGEPQIYAESILKVCEYYLASPVACAAGVTGGELKKRIEGIMTDRFTRDLNFGKKMLLAAAALVALTGPVVIGLTNPTRSRAQAQSGPLPSFEVASVKPSAPSARPITRLTGGPGTSSPGQLVGDNVMLRLLLTRAYDLMPWQLIGADRLYSDKYDIAAKIPPGATKERVNLMLQNLLVERFGLTAHWETRELPIYEAVVAEGGPKLKAPEPLPAGAPRPEPGQPLTLNMMAKDKDGFPVLPPGVPRFLPIVVNGSTRITARMEPITVLWADLERRLLRPVVDKTGLTGTYDFDLTYLPEEPVRHSSTLEGGPPDASQPSAGQAGVLDAGSDTAPNLFAAIKSQLGLKLESKRGPVKVLVIDHVEKVPTAN
jgi:bla regulator protein BlaR1